MTMLATIGMEDYAVFFGMIAMVVGVAGYFVYCVWNWMTKRYED
jgi:hypothetical protein